MNLYKLNNQFKHYEWGSLNLIPGFLDIKNKKGLPYAEMWMGTHNGAPSMLESSNLLLKEAAGELPFLLKLLAVEKPLSIQAHPNIEFAKEGYSRENQQGIPLDSLKRNYKDAGQKPEILCALTPFLMMAGFIKTQDIYNSFKNFMPDASHFNGTFFSLLNTLESGSIINFIKLLLNFSAPEREFFRAYIQEKESIKTEFISLEQWKLMKYFAALFPKDAFILSPLFLNILALQPFQAVYIPCGVPHSYLSGFAIELMTSSDNVLRGGLTFKHTNTGELIKILDFNPYFPQIMTPNDSGFFRYPAPCKELSLSMLKSNSNSGQLTLNKCVPSICLVTEGSLTAADENLSISCKKGESFFITGKNEAQKLELNGNFTLFAASAGL